MKIEEAQIIDNKLILSKQLLKILKWKYPFYQIPQLKDYSQRIIDYSKENNQLPFYLKFDINNDGKDEIMLIQKSIIGGFGRLLIISSNNSKFRFEKIKWSRSVNSLFFDYLIDIAQPKEYQTFGFKVQGDNNDLSDSMKSKKVIVNYPHIITKGYLTRIVYWDGVRYCQERISTLIDSEGN